MASRIKGITIEIDGNTTKLSKALKGVNQNLNNTQKKLKDVNRLLKIDPTNTTLLRQKQKLLGSQISDTKAKTKTLKKALKELKKADSTPEVKEHQAQLKREIIASQQQLKSFKAQLKNANYAKVDKLAKSFENVGAKVTQTGKQVATGLGVPIIAAGGASVKMASDLEENLNKVGVAFGDSKQTVIDWTDTATTQFGLSKNEALEMTSLFGDMGTSMGLAGSDSAKMSMDLAGLAGDLSSFKNIGVDEAMTALKGVFTGETESLKNLGVVMTQTNLEDFAAKQGKVLKEMSESEKVSLRYAYVLEKTKNAQGDYANTSDGVANSSRTAKAQIENLGASIGTILLPYVQQALAKVNEVLTAFNNLSPEGKKMIVSIGLIGIALGPMLMILGRLIATMGTVVKVIRFFVLGLKGLFALMLANPIAVMIGAIVALVAGFIYLWNTSEEFRQFWINLWETIKETTVYIITSVVDAFKIIFTGLFLLLKGILTGISNFFIAIWNGIKSVTVAIFNGIKTAITNSLNLIKTFIVNILNAYINAFKTIFNAIKSVVTFVFNGIKSIITNVLTAVKTVIQTILGTIKSIISRILNIYINIFKTIFNAIKSVVSSVFTGIKSIITSILNGVKNTVSSIFNGMKSAISSTLNATKSVVSSVFNGIKSAITRPVESAVGVVKGCISKIKGAFNFSWKLPKLKMPSISISGGFSLKPLSVPKFGIQWNAKGGLFTGPSIVGNQGFGEAGPEYALPLNKQSLTPLANMLNMLGGDNGGLGSKLDLNNQLMQELIRSQQQNIVLDSGELVGATVSKFNAALGGGLL